MRLLLLIFAISAVIYENDCGTTSSTTPSSTTPSSTPSSTTPSSTTPSSTTPSSTTPDASTTTTPDASTTTPPAEDPTTTPADDPTTAPAEDPTTAPTEAPTTPAPTTVEPTTSSVYISFMGPNAAINVASSSGPVAMAIRTAVNDYCSMNVGACCADASAMVPMGGVQLSSMDSSGTTAAFQATVSFGCSTPLSPALLDTILSSPSAVSAINAALGSTGVTVQDVTVTLPTPDQSRMLAIVLGATGGVLGLLLLILLTCCLAYCTQSLNRPILPFRGLPRPPPFRPYRPPRPPPQFRGPRRNPFQNFTQGPPTYQAPNYITVVN